MKSNIVNRHPLSMVHDSLVVGWKTSNPFIELSKDNILGTILEKFFAHKN